MPRIPLSKRLFDLLATSLGLLILSPILLILALLVRIFLGTEKAVSWFTDAVRLAPHGDVFRTWLALMHLELGQDELAAAVIKDARSVARLDADNDIVLAEELLGIYRAEFIAYL